MKKLVIVGDSFGCGEWGIENNKYQVLHSGLEQYFTDYGFNVTNLSVAGGSNRYSIFNLNHFLKNNINYDGYIIFVQTEPLRDTNPFFIKDTDNWRSFYKSIRQSNWPKSLSPYKLPDYVENFLKSNFEYDPDLWFSPKYHQVDNLSDLINLNDNYLDQDYNLLNQLNRKIICIGGCSKLDLTLLKKYNNLCPVIPSVPEFLIPEIPHPKIIVNGWLRLINKNIDTDSLDQLLFNSSAILKWKARKEFFWPDGTHPNRHSWKLVFDYLISQGHFK